MAIIDPTDLQKPTGRGIFIVLEGVNGAGKTTLRDGLTKHFEALGRSVVITGEPGGSAIGGEVRKIVLERNPGALSPMTELLLISADRCEHVKTIIRPALTDHRVVICDRYLYSSMAFQGYGGGLDQDTIRTVSNQATDGQTPDLVILLDLPPKAGLERTRKRANSSADSFEDQTTDYHIRVREGFLTIAKEDPAPFMIFDASQPADQVLTSVIQSLSSFA